MTQPTTPDPKPEPLRNAWTVLLSEWDPEGSAQDQWRADRDRRWLALVRRLSHFTDEQVLAFHHEIEIRTGETRPEAATMLLAAIANYREPARQLEERMSAYDAILTADG